MNNRFTTDQKEIRDGIVETAMSMHSAVDRCAVVPAARLHGK